MQPVVLDRAGSSWQQRRLAHVSRAGGVYGVRVVVGLAGPLDGRAVRTHLHDALARRLPHRALAWQPCDDPGRSDAATAWLDGHRLTLVLPAGDVDRESAWLIVAEAVRAACAELPTTREEQAGHASFVAWQHHLGRTGQARIIPPGPAHLVVAGAASVPPLVIERELSEHEERMLAAIAQQASASMDAVVLSAWRRTVAELVPDASIAVRVSGRFPGIEGMVGPLERYLPIPAAPTDAASCEAEVAALAGDQHLLALPPEWLDAGGPEIRCWPFGFDADAGAARMIRAGAITATLIASESAIDRFAWHLRFSVGDGTARLRLLVDPAFLDGADPHAVLDRIRSCAIEREEAGPGAPPPTVAERVARHAAETPARIALRAATGHWTYGALSSRANALARHLISAGVLPDTVVAVRIPRSPELVASILGILSSGAAFLPCDPALPPDRLAGMLVDARARILVTTRGLEPLPGLPLDSVVIVDDLGAEHCGPPDRPRRRPHPDHLAYVMFTSGSTGRPKGVMVTHAGLTNYVDWSVRAYGLSIGSASILHTSLSYDLALTEVLSPLAAGGEVEVLAEGVGIEHLRSALAGDEPLHLLKLTPAHLRLLREDSAGRPPRRPVRVLVVGGEAFHAEHAAWWRDARPDLRIVNEYGPTEAVVGCSAYELPAGGLGVGAIPIGSAIHEARLHVLDDLLVPVRPGEIGELYVGGICLARGYAGAPDLTAQRFIPDPFSARGGERLYRTGDLVTDVAGKLEYRGRRDRQIKRSGFRIEPGEIEEALRRHRGVNDAIVIPDANGVLHAFVAADHGSAQPWRMPDGLVIEHLNRNEATHLHSEIFGQRQYLRGGIRIADGDTIVDVGANVGVFCMFACTQAADLRIFAIEPVPPLFEILRRNIARHRLPVKPLLAAAADRTGSAAVTFYPRMTVMSGLHADDGVDERVSSAFLADETPELAAHARELLDGRFAARTFRCDTVTLRQVIASEGITRIDLLKIDCEKSEEEALAGLGEEDWSIVRQVVAEVHAEGHRVERVVGGLLRRGFEVAVEGGGSGGAAGLCLVYARRERPRGDAVPIAGPQPPAATGEADPFLADVRDAAARILPEHMLPSRYHVVPSIPLTANGKVDAATLLAAAAPTIDVEPEPEPASSEEVALGSIWSALLSVPKVRPDDNFFALGGDSILTIQVVAQARRAGLAISPRDVFEQPRLRDLARVAARPRSTTRVSEPEPPGGTIGLTRMQRRFLTSVEVDADWFAQSAVLSWRPGWSSRVIAAAVDSVVAAHPALSARFARIGGGWRQRLGLGRRRDVFSIVDLADLGTEEADGCFAREAARAQRSLDIREGPVFRALLFRQRNSLRLLLVAHHLVVDRVSWSILIEDVAAAALAARDRGIVSTPPDPYARSLDAGGRADDVAPAGLLDVPRLPCDAGAGPGAQRDEAVASGRLDARTTDALIRTAAQGLGARIHDVLAAAVAMAISRWTGSSRIAIEIEDHGRDHAEMDLSRVVGWLSRSSIRIYAPRAGGTIMDAVAEARPAVEVGDGAGPWGPAEVAVNYSGSTDATAMPDMPFELTPWANSAGRSPRCPRPYLLAFHAAVRDGRLGVELCYNRVRHGAERARALVDDVLAALHSPAAAARIRTPAGPNAFDGASYPLTTLQSGLLYHELRAGERGAYRISITCRMRGAFDEAAFRRAWQEMIAGHDVLRTSFHWQDVDAPMQRVHESASDGIVVIDHRHDPDSAGDRFAQLVTEEGGRGFRIDRPPLMRLSAVRSGDDETLLLWNFHHLILDGWSMAELLAEFARAYAAGGRAAPARDTRPAFASYVRWLGSRPRRAEEAFWRRELSGLVPSPPGAEPALPSRTAGVERGECGPGPLRDVIRSARACAVTLATAVQAAWALALARQTGRDEVVFGITVSGRDISLADAHRVIGPMISTVPLRLQVPRGQPVRRWLELVHARQARVREHASASLGEIARWAGVATADHLFESILVHENYPSSLDREPAMAGLRIDAISFSEPSHYPLTLSVSGQRSLEAKLTFTGRSVDAAAARALLAGFWQALDEMAAPDLILEQRPARGSR